MFGKKDQIIKLQNEMIEQQEQLISKYEELLDINENTIEKKNEHIDVLERINVLNDSIIQNLETQVSNLEALGRDLLWLNNVNEDAINKLNDAKYGEA